MPLRRDRAIRFRRSRAVSERSGIAGAQANGSVKFGRMGRTTEMPRLVEVRRGAYARSSDLPRFAAFDRRPVAASPLFLPADTESYSQTKRP